MSKPTAFPLDESRLPFEIPRDEPYREKIARLGQMITDRIPAKKGILTKDDPEYWGLASIVTDEMADVALKMKVRKPMTLPELVKATGKPAGELEPLLQQMAVVGLLEYNWENPRREKQYILPMFVPGSAEFFNMNKQQIADHPEVTAFFERMTFLPLEHITAMVPPGGAGIGMHVIPVEKAIETENRSADIEHISHWLKKYDGKYAAGPCSCRMSRAAMGEGCGDDPDDWCIGVGDMADYLVETNKGHYVTYDEVMQILQKAEDNGFVHQITNIDGENKIFAICNCNVNVCNALRTSQLFNTPNMSRSAYVARVEPENCVACGRCVEYCPAGAVKLGQKLCTKDGPITYPKQELPDAVKWGPDKWAIDYRDKNRINCYDTGTAPCKTACPAHIAVQGYLKMAAQGRYRDALALIKKENPFPAVCGRVCNRRCEDACTRGTVDQAVAIDAVKKFIAEQDLNAAHRYVPDVVQPSLQGPWPQKIAIIGGGNVAIDAARVSLRCGSDGVTMVCLEPRDKMPASPEEIAEAEEEGTRITCGYGPKEFLSENGHVTAVVLKKCTGLYNAEGRFAPTYDENDTIALPCDNVVLSIGQCIEWGDLLNGEAVQLGRGQGAVADALTYQTAQPDIFVGGDVCTGPRFAIDAIAAGKQGAISIHRFVQPNTSLTIGRNRRDFHELDKSNLALGEYDRAPRQSAALDAGIDAHRSFRDAHLTLTEDQVKIETARCLGCGASVVDPNKCIGCGVCTTKCEFDAIRLHRDLPECSKMVRSEDKFKAILPYMAKREIKIRFAKKEK